MDSDLYGVTMEEAEMHYLAEHWGELGAEQQHEINVLEAIDGVANLENYDLILEGIHDVLNSLARLWDIVDASLLQSGYSLAA